MKADRIFETVLYASDIEAVKYFYEEILQMELIRQFEGWLAFRCGRGVLLIFDPEISAEQNRDVPSHGMEGQGHIAFAAGEADLKKWRRRFLEYGIEIEMEKEWESGGRSIYVRDPAGNSVEFAPSTLWGGGWDF